MRSLLLLALLLVGGAALTLGLQRSAESRTVPLTPYQAAALSATPAASTASPTPSQPAEPDPNTHAVEITQSFLCTSCHRQDGGWVLPDSHKEMSQDCQGCHAPAPTPEPVRVHFLPGDTETQALCALCHGDLARTQTPAVAPEIPEAQTCASCHAGDDDVEPPEDHEGRSVATCKLCHSTETLSAGFVPHEVEGWEDCAFCHGRGRLTPLDGGHTDMPTEECSGCHEAFEPPPHMPAVMLDHAVVRDGCTSCHSFEKSAPLPLSHEGRTEETCLLCHAPR